MDSLEIYVLTQLKQQLATLKAERDGANEQLVDAAAAANNAAAVKAQLVSVKVQLASTQQELVLCRETLNGIADALFQIDERKK